MEGAFYKKWCDLKEHAYYAERSRPLRAHYHQGVEVVYCVDGPTEFTLGGETVSMERGSVLAVDSYVIHSCTTCGTIRTVLIPPSYLGAYDASKQHRVLEHPHIPAGEEAERVLAIIMQLAEGESYEPLEVHGLCDQLLGMLCRVCGLREGSDTADTAMSRRLLIYMGSHFKEELSLEQTAEELAYSKYYISRTLNRLVGVNFPTFLNQLRLRAFEAAVRESPKESLPKLAADCGFQSAQTFYRVFRREYGMTPRAFAAQMQNGGIA